MRELQSLSQGCHERVFQSGEGEDAVNMNEPAFETGCPAAYVSENAPPERLHFGLVWSEAVSQLHEVAMSMPHIDPREELLARYAQVAARLAEPAARQMGDEGEWFVDLVGLHGPWATGSTPWEALRHFEDAVLDWASAKLDHGDRDLPMLDDIDMNILAATVV